MSEMIEETEIPPVTAIHRLDVRPSDRLVVSTDRPLTKDWIDHLRKVLREWCGGEIPILIVPSEIHISVVSKETAEAFESRARGASR